MKKRATELKIATSSKVVLPWLVAGATLLVGVASALSAFSPIAYDIREERTNARALLEVDGLATNANYAYRYSSTRIDDQLVAVTYVEPLRPDAVPPPGVTSWPEPGESAISPALVGIDSIAFEFGNPTQVIGVEGLGSPTERLIYSRPPEQAIDIGMQLSDGFGAGFTLEPASEALSVQPLPIFLGMQWITTVVPALVLFSVAVSLSGSLVRERSTQLEVLGMVPRLAWWESSKSLLKIVLAGWLMALIPVLVLQLTGLRILGFAVLASDLRASWWITFAFWLVGGILVLGITIFSTFERSAIGNRPRKPEPRFSGWIALMFLIAIAAAAVWTLGEARMANLDFMYGIYATSVLVALGAYPISGWLLAQIWEVLIHGGRFARRPGLLINGREGVHHPGRGVSAVASTVVAIFLIVQFSTYGLLMVASGTDAWKFEQAYGSRFTVVELQSLDSESWQRMEQMMSVLPPDADAVMVTLNTFVPSGEVPVARVWRYENESTVVDIDKVINADIGFPIEEAGTLEEAEAELGSESIFRLLIGVPEGQTLNSSELKSEANRLVKPAWLIALPSWSWVSAMLNGVHQARWLMFFGTFALVTLLCASWLRLGSDMVVSGKSTVVLSAGLGLDGLASWVMRVRVLITVGVGLFLAAAIAYPFARVIEILGFPVSVPMAMLGLMLLATAAVGVVALVVVPRIVDKETSDWRPR
ncbi:MAG: hypothetical protein WAS54_04115 [Scrofimicrobium sp.]